MFLSECPYCGAALDPDEDIEVCPNCGAELDQIQAILVQFYNMLLNLQQMTVFKIGLHVKAEITAKVV